MLSVHQINNALGFLKEYNAIRVELERWQLTIVPTGEQFHVMQVGSIDVKITGPAFKAAKEEMVKKYTSELEGVQKRLFIELQVSLYSSTDNVLLEEINKYLNLLRRTLPYIEGLEADNIHDPGVGLRRDEELASLHKDLKEIFEPTQP